MFKRTKPFEVVSSMWVILPLCIYSAHPEQSASKTTPTVLVNFLTTVSCSHVTDTLRRITHIVFYFNTHLQRNLRRRASSICPLFVLLKTCRNHAPHRSHRRATFVSLCIVLIANSPYLLCSWHWKEDTWNGIWMLVFWMRVWYMMIF